jgi:hypothetical protein
MTDSDAEGGRPFVAYHQLAAACLSEDHIEAVSAPAAAPS